MNDSWMIWIHEKNVDLQQLIRNHKLPKYKSSENVINVSWQNTYSEIKADSSEYVRQN